MKGRGVRGALQLPLRQASWRRASGEVGLSGDVDLARLVDLLPPNTVPLAGASGKVTLAGHVSRRGASDAIPDVTLSLKTAGLRFETRTVPDLARGRTMLVAAPKTQVSGVDVAADLEASVAAKSGRILVSVVDAHGTVASVDARSTAIPYAELASAPATFAERMLRVPFTVRVAVPPRSLEQLPDVLRLDGASGTADLTASIEGTALDPRVAVHGGMHSLRITGARRTGPSEVELTGKYDGAVADAALHVTGP